MKYKKNDWRYARATDKYVWIRFFLNSYIYCYLNKLSIIQVLFLKSETANFNPQSDLIKYNFLICPGKYKLISRRSVTKVFKHKYLANSNSVAVQDEISAMFVFTKSFLRDKQRISQQIIPDAIAEVFS